MLTRRALVQSGAWLPLTAALAGCSSVYTSSDSLSYEEAVSELASLMKKIDVTYVDDPVLDLSADTTTEADALSDISTFEVVAQSDADIVIEVAAATECSSDSPDDWLIKVAEAFNEGGYTVGDKTVGVQIRQIASGEAYTYIAAGAWEPELFIPSNEAWGLMLEAKGIEVTQLEERLAGNTAGILMSPDAYDTFIDSYGEVTLKNVLAAATAGDITFAYTNPYTSSTGLNLLASMLAAFDEDDPLSEEAEAALLAYQQTSPPVAYTTSVLRSSAEKGIIDTMVMECQAYVNSAELADYVFTPFGIRHDHPAYTFGWASDEEQAAAALFCEECLSSEMQDLADERGFNLHEDYVSQDSGLDGAGYIAAQKIWKTSKTGGNPQAAVFVADVSGSMAGEPLSSLQEALVTCAAFISTDTYVGLVSYSDDVVVNLPLAQFDDTQRAYFAGEVGALVANGSTATYDAVLVACNMLVELGEEVPNLLPMVFLLSDGAQNEGYSLDRASTVVDGLDIPIYTIAYNYSGSDELTELSELNEAAALVADSDDLMNQLRNLFNATA